MKNSLLGADDSHTRSRQSGGAAGLLWARRESYRIPKRHGSHFKRLRSVEVGATVAELRAVTNGFEDRRTNGFQKHTSTA